ncbi:MAG: DUF2029 domain-containing protein [Chitinivibrionales bacterium]|nr:DUF2029 domain-containing protein [Chitinivibrionales bacterium]
MVQSKSITKSLPVIYRTLCIGIALCNIGIIVIAYDSEKKTDFNIYCCACDAHSQGRNPYLVQNIEVCTQREISFTYLPVVLPVFKALCRFENKILTYHFLWSILLALNFVLIAFVFKFKHLATIVAIVMAGYSTTYWNFYTGNIGLFESLLFITFLLLVLKNRLFLATVPLTVISSLKILPLVFVSLLFFTPDSTGRKVKAAGMTLLLFATIHLLSFVAYQDIYPSYLAAVTGSQASQHSAIKEEGGKHNPSLMNFINDAVSDEKEFDPAALTAYVILAALIIGIYFLILQRNAAMDSKAKISLFALVLLLILPRLKPYSFGYAFLPVAILMANMKTANKLFIVLISCGFTFVMLVSTSFAPGLLKYVVIDYMQLGSLVAAIAYIFLSMRC